jgi:radical SAM superfamily enzyme YgiQ (UPF0313 family)
MKICAYVMSKYAKQTYKHESFNIRLFAGLMIVIDILKGAGYTVEFAGSATVHKYDIVLVSITSDCDWWGFIAERTTWQKGNYKVIAGGAGVLNVRPFLQYVDYFCLGRAEGIIDNLITGNYQGDSVIESKTFNTEKSYYINQVNEIYPYKIKLENGDTYQEDSLGCNHKCLFCGYTWHRKHISNKAFEYSGLWNGGVDRERAILDIAKGEKVDFNKLRTTAIDGLSQRLRFMVNKKITREVLQDFIYRLAACEKPHQVKFYNILGYPTEIEEDWQEFLEDIRLVDEKLPKSNKQTSILLHSTPFRAMPATPMACEPMSYKNYRGAVANTLGKDLKGNIFYQGNAIWAVESMGTESLSTVIESAVILRGTENDTDNIAKIAKSNKYKNANTGIKTATLEKYFDVAKLFKSYTVNELPTKYLKTYCDVYKVGGIYERK